MKGTTICIVALCLALALATPPEEHHYHFNPLPFLGVDVDIEINDLELPSAQVEDVVNFERKPLITKELLTELYTTPKNWTHKVYPQFIDLTIADIRKQFLGAFSSEENVKKIDLTKDFVGQIPEDFNSRDKWPNCVHEIRDQQRCGSCWAFGATEALSDRFCIATNGNVNVVLSPQYLVSCDNTDAGCNGGYIHNAWTFMASSGVVSDTCFPYISGKGTTYSCSTFKNKCEDGQPVKKYYVQPESVGVLENPQSIQIDILQNGPTETRFDVYEDFMTYESGIYHHTTGQRVGGHAIKVVGWGVEDGVSYWICANSWGPNWGEEGFFRIRFGECGIDSTAATGLPDVNRL